MTHALAKRQNVNEIGGQDHCLGLSRFLDVH